MDLGLKDVHALITGASGGIGLETVRVFLSNGAKVTAHYHANSEPLQRLLAESNPSQLRLAQADLNDENSAISLFAPSTFGPVQVVIINHAVSPTKDEPVIRMSLERWKSTIDTNLTSSFLVAREFLRQLEPSPEDVKDKAAIVLIGSTAGKYGEAGHADYAATKSAMMYGLTLSLKNEIVKIAPRGRVNCVGPGWVETPMSESTLKDQAFVSRALATTPLRRIAEPRDIANQIVVLASSTVSGHVTGQVVMVEGGMEGRLLNLREV